MDNNKKYTFHFSIDNSSLKSAASQIEDTLNNAVADGMQLDRSGKAAVKSSLSQIFDIAEDEAKRLSEVMKTVGNMDDSQVQLLTGNLKEMLDVVSQIMSAMKDTNNSLDWMKNGRKLVDNYNTLQAALEKLPTDKLDKLESSLSRISTEFESFKNAFKVNDPEAFFKRFGDSAEKEISRLEKIKARLEKSGNFSGITESIAKGKSDSSTVEDFVGLSSEEIEEKYSAIKATIQENLTDILKIEKDYLKAKNKKSLSKTDKEILYSKKDYQRAIQGLAKSYYSLESLQKHLGGTSGISLNIDTSEIKSTVNEAANILKEAKNDLQSAIEGLGLKDIELAINIPDANSEEITKKINTFIDDIQKQVTAKPVDVEIEISPIKISSKQQLSNGKEQTIKELLKDYEDVTAKLMSDYQGIVGEGVESIDLDNIKEGLSDINLHTNLADFVKSFVKMLKTINSSQNILKDKTKAWQEDMGKLLKLKFQWEKDGLGEEAESELTKLFNIVNDFASRPENYIQVIADEESLISSIEEILKSKVFDVNLKGSFVDTPPAVISGTTPVAGTPIVMVPSAGNIVYPQSAPSTPAASIVHSTSAIQKEPIDNIITENTTAISQNETAVEKSTEATGIFANAINSLTSQIALTVERKGLIEKNISDYRAEADSNIDTINSRKESIDYAQQQQAINKIDKETLELKLSNKQLELKNLKKNKEYQETIKQVKETQEYKDKENQIQNLLKELDKGNIDKYERNDILKRVSEIRKEQDYLLYPVLKEIEELEKQLTQKKQDGAKLQNTIISLQDDVKNLQKADKIDESNKNLIKFQDEEKVQRRRLSVLQSLGSNEDPASIVTKSVENFWKDNERTQKRSRAVLDGTDEEIKALNAKLELLKQKLQGAKEGTEEYNKILEEQNDTQKKIENKISYNKSALRNAEDRASKMESLGLVKGIDNQGVKNLLRANNSLGNELSVMRGSENQKLSTAGIEDLAFFVETVQQEMGIIVKTIGQAEYDSKLQQKLINLVKTAKELESINNLISKGKDISEQDLESFIKLYEYVPDMQKAVQAAKRYVEAFKNVEALSEGNVAYAFGEFYGRTDEYFTSEISKAFNALSSGTNYAALLNYTDKDGNLDISKIQDEKGFKADFIAAIREVLDNDNYDVNNNLEKRYNTQEDRKLIDVLRFFEAYIQKTQALEGLEQEASSRAPTGTKRGLKDLLKLDKPLSVKIVDEKTGTDTVYGLTNKKDANLNVDSSHNTTLYGIDKFLTKSNLKKPIEDIVNRQLEEISLKTEQKQLQQEQQTVDKNSERAAEIERRLAEIHTELTSKESSSELLRKLFQDGKIIIREGKSTEIKTSAKEYQYQDTKYAKDKKELDTAIKQYNALPDDDENRDAKNLLRNKIEMLSASLQDEQIRAEALAAIENDLIIARAKEKEALEAQRISGRLVNKSNRQLSGRTTGYANDQIAYAKNSYDHIGVVDSIASMVEIAKKYGILSSEVIQDLEVQIGAFNQTKKKYQDLDIAKGSISPENQAKKNLLYNALGGLKENIAKVFWGQDGALVIESLTGALSAAQTDYDNTIRNASLEAQQKLSQNDSAKNEIRNRIQLIVQNANSAIDGLYYNLLETPFRELENTIASDLNSQKLERDKQEQSVLNARENAKQKVLARIEADFRNKTGIKTEIAKKQEAELTKTVEITDFKEKQKARDEIQKKYLQQFNDRVNELIEQELASSVTELKTIPNNRDTVIANFNKYTAQANELISNYYIGYLNSQQEQIRNLLESSWQSSDTQLSLHEYALQNNKAYADIEAAKQSFDVKLIDPNIITNIINNFVSKYFDDTQEKIRNALSDQWRRDGIRDSIVSKYKDDIEKIENQLSAGAVGEHRVELQSNLTALQNKMNEELNKSLHEYTLAHSKEYLDIENSKKSFQSNLNGTFQDVISQQFISSIKIDTQEFKNNFSIWANDMINAALSVLPSVESLAPTVETIKAEAERTLAAAIQSIIQSFQLGGGRWIDDIEITRRKNLNASENDTRAASEATQVVKDLEAQRDAIKNENTVRAEIGEVTTAGTQIIERNKNAVQNQLGVMEEVRGSIADSNIPLVPMEPVSNEHYMPVMLGGASIDNSNIAKESTLRAIYELLNGAPPVGGWEESTQKFANSVDKLVANVDESDIASKQFTNKDWKHLLSNASNRKTEAGYVIGQYGQIGEAIRGAKGSVSSNDISSALAKFVNEQILAVFHNHPSGLSAFSGKDLYAAVARAFSIGAYNSNKSVGMSGVISNNKLSTLDFSGISYQQALDIANRYSENLIATGKFKRTESGAEVAYGIKADKELEQLANKILRDTIQQVLGEDSISNIFKQFTFSNIGDLAAQLSTKAAEVAEQSVKQIDYSNINTDASKEVQDKILKATNGFGENIASIFDITDLLLKAGQGVTTPDELSKINNVYQTLLGENKIDSDVHPALDSIAASLDSVITNYITNFVNELSKYANMSSQQSNSNLKAAAQNAKPSYNQLRFNEFKQIMDASWEQEKSDKKNNVENPYKRDNKEIDLSMMVTKLSNLLSIDFSKLDQKASGKKLVDLANKSLELEEFATKYGNNFSQNIQQYIRDTLLYVKEVLKSNNISIVGQKLLGKTVEESYLSRDGLPLIKGSRKNNPAEVGKVISKVHEPAIVRGNEVLQSAKVLTKKAEAAAEVLGIEKQTTKEDIKQAEAAQQKASAEKESADVLEKSSSKTPTPPVTPLNNNETQNTGGILGALGRIAQEETLSQILGIIRKGITVNEKNSKPDQKEKSKEALSNEDAISILKNIAFKDYSDVVMLNGIRTNDQSVSLDVYRAKTPEEKTNAAERLLEIEQRLNELEADGLLTSKEAVLLQAEQARILQSQEKITLRINKQTGKVTTRTFIKDMALGATAAEKELQKVANIIERLNDAHALGINAEGNITSQNQLVQNYINSVQALKVFRDDLSREELFAPENQQTLHEMSMAIQNYRIQLEDLLSINTQISSGKSIGFLANVSDIDNIDKLKQVMSEIVAKNKDTEVEFGKLEPITDALGNTYYKLFYTMKAGKGNIQEMTAVLNPLTNEIIEQTGALKPAVEGWAKWISMLKSKMKSILQYTISIASIQRIFGLIRQGLQYVKEIDSAMVELRKVTDETSKTYDEFAKSASEVANRVGSTMSSIIASTADWSRLGYSIAEAGELAKNTAILMNVSEFDDINRATDTMISALQAYKKEGNSVVNLSEEIVDKFNEVGNNYAISTSDLAESLTRSSATLVAAGNTLSESIALTTAANTIIQDPDSVGNALKVVSMRLRGTTAKEITAVGEEVDGLITSTSKLATKVRELTSVDGEGGINILTDAGAYKSTYQILLEISKVWSQISDTKQAALLELLAGKTRGSVVAGLLQNGSLLENILKSAENSKGSSLKELQVHLDSIQGKIERLTNSIQTLWNNFLDDEIIKGLVDIANWIVEVINKFEVLPTAFGAWGTLSAIKKYSDDKQPLVSSIVNAITQGFDKVANKATKTSQPTSSSSSSKQTSATTNASITSVASNTGEAISGIVRQQEAMDNLNESITENIEINEKSIETKKQDSQVIDFQTGQTIDLIDAQQQDNNAVKQGISSRLKLIGVKIKDIALDTIKKIGIAALQGAAMALVGYIINKAITAWQEYKQRMKDLKTEAINAAKALEDNRDSISDYNDEIKKLRITLADNTSTEREAYDARMRLMEIQDDIISKYGKEAEGINLVTGSIKEQMAAIDALDKKNANKYVTEHAEAFEDAKTSLNKSTKSSMTFAQGQIDNSVWDLFEAYMTDLGFEQTVNPNIIVDDSGSIFDTPDSYTFKIKDTKVNLENIYSDIIAQIGEWADQGFDVDGIRKAVSAEINNLDFNNEDYVQNKEVLDSYIQEKAVADYTTEYKAIVDAQAAYNNAVGSGNTTAKSEALNNYKLSLQKAVEVAEDKGEQYMADYFNEQLIGLEAEIKQTNFMDAVKDSSSSSNKMAKKVQNAITSAGLTQADILNMLRLDKAGELDNSGYAQDQIEAFKELQKEAEAAEIDVKSATDALVQLGYVKISPDSVGIDNVGKSLNLLQSSTAAYENAMAVSRELTYDNMQISEDYYTQLANYLSDYAEFNEAVNTENGEYIITNSKLINDLIKLKRKEQAADVKLSKSQAQLRYYELYKEMRKLTNGQGQLTGAALDEVNALYDQMNAVEKTIVQYSLLEQQLLGTTDAFSEFEKAKTIDSETDYIGSTKEMIAGLFKGFETGLLGTEAVQAAIAGLVPESVYEDLDTVDEKMAAIHKYAKEDLSRYFTIKYDDEGAVSSIDSNFGNMTKFIQDGRDKGVFVGPDNNHIELSDEITSLQDLADAFKITDEVAFALLKHMEDMDIEWLDGDYQSFLDKLSTEDLTYQIYDTTSALADLEYKMANGKISAEEYGKQYSKLYSELSTYTAKAKDEVFNYINSSAGMNDEIQASRNQVSSLTIRLNDLTTKLEESERQGLDTTQLMMDIEETKKLLGEATEKLNEVIQAKYDLGAAPTEVEIQIVLDDIDAKKKEIQDKLGEKSYEIDIDYEFDEKAQEYKIKAGIEETEDLKNYISLLNEEHTLNVYLGNATIETQEGLDKCVKTINDAKKALEELEKIEPDINTSTIQASLDDVKKKAQTVSDAIAGLSKTITIEVQEKYISPSNNNNNYSYPPLSGDFASVNGSAHASGEWGIPSAEHDSLVGELGQELVVDPQSGRYYTVGDHGAEMVDLPKGAIIFNHKQTEALLSKGYVTSRGRAYAEGNAHLTRYPNGVTLSNNNTSSNGNNGDDDTNKEILDFIEIKLEEIDQHITTGTAALETLKDDTSQTGLKKQYYDTLVADEKNRKNTYAEARDYYQKKAQELLNAIPEDYKTMAQNGAIAIKDFVGEDQAKIAEAIQEYRDMDAKFADAEAGYFESISQIAQYRLEEIQDIADDYENNISLIETESELINSQIDLLEASGERIGSGLYKELINNVNAQKKQLEKEKGALQKELDAAVENDEIKVGTDDWYEAITLIADVDKEITQCGIDAANFQNAINDLKWDNLDKLIDRFDAIDSELSHLYSRFTDGDVVDEAGNWTDKGIAAMGVLAQQMEVAQYKSEQYAKAINDLKKDYKNGLYSTDEYNEKLAELTENQWESIEAYEDAKDKIVDLNKTRIDAVKNSMQKEIDAYKELINKQKELLDAEKDLYSFEKNLKDQQKTISDIERKIAALSGDTSMSAVAQKKQLEAELLEAKEELNEMYYERSIQDQQDALDKEYENYEESMNKEMETLDESLKNEEQIILDSMNTVKNNASTVLAEMNEVSATYGIKLSNNITQPWENGKNAVSGYKDSFSDLCDSFAKQLDALIAHQKELQRQAEATAVAMAKTVGGSFSDITSASNPVDNNASSNSSNKTNNTNNNKQSSDMPSKGDTVTVKKSATNYSSKSGNKPMASFVKGGSYTVYQTSGNQVLIGKNGVYTGWVNKDDLVGYKKGTTGVKEDQWAWIDEIGEELVLHAGSDGKLEYLTKGTSVIPSKLTEKLMDLALDPTQMLEYNRPVISASHVINNEINIDMSFGSVVNIEHVDNDTLPDLTKAVEKQMDKYMARLNNQIRKFAR